MKLTFGAASNTLTVSVPPSNQPTTEATLDVPGALDCQATGGIPSLDYALTTGLKVSGKLEASEVLFSP